VYISIAYSKNPVLAPVSSRLRGGYPARYQRDTHMIPPNKPMNNEPIRTPDKGDAECNEILDAVRQYWSRDIKERAGGGGEARVIVLSGSCHSSLVPSIRLFLCPSSIHHFYQSLSSFFGAIKYQNQSKSTCDEYKVP